MTIMIGVIAIVGWVAFFRKMHECNEMESFIIGEIVNEKVTE